MAQDPLVSIIIPCHNYGEFLGEAIDSALGQDYSQIEVIVIDDGSTDSSQKVAQAYGSKISYYYQLNQGLSAARNAGVKRAQGEYVLFLDADDILDPAFVSKTLPLLKSDPKLSFVYTQMRWFGRENRLTTYPEYSLKTLKFGNYINATALIRRSIFEKIQYDSTFNTGWEDLNFYLTVAELGGRGKLLNEPLLNYRKHSSAESMVDLVSGSLEKERTLIEKIMAAHPKLYGPLDKLVIELKYPRNRLILQVRKTLGALKQLGARG